MRRPVNEVLPDTLEYFQYSAARLRPHLWHIHDATRDHPPGEQPDGSFHSPSSTYVIEDEGEVLVIDLGVPTQDTHLRELVERIAGGRSIKAALTHNHFDHTGGLEQFSDCPIYVPARDLVPGAAHPIPVSGGDVIHMPHYAFQVLDAPGHTAGSILFYEQARDWLATGDAFGSSYVWLLFLPDAVRIYQETLRRTLRTLEKSEPLLFLCGHRYQQQFEPVPGIHPLSPRNPDMGLDYLRDMLVLTGQILEGRAVSRPFSACGRDDLAAYTYGRAEIDACLPGRPPVLL